MDLYESTERLKDAESLDPVAEKLADLAGGIIGDGSVKDALTGRWLGHALHPPLTDIPIGAFTSATILDLFGGDDAQAGADTLIGVGLLTSLPTAAAGLADWSDTISGDRRVGLVHAASNIAALALYAASLGARRAGRRRGGVALALLGGAATVVGGYLGGHLAFSRGVGVDQTVFEQGPTEWTSAGPEDRLAEDKPQAVEVEGATLVMLKKAGRVYALSHRCSHLGCPLEEGEVRGTTIVCACHGSHFSMSDGAVLGGPARAPQPAYDTKIEDGEVKVRLRS